MWIQALKLCFLSPEASLHPTCLMGQAAESEVKAGITALGPGKTGIHLINIGLSVWGPIGHLSMLYTRPAEVTWISRPVLTSPPPPPRLTGTHTSVPPPQAPPSLHPGCRRRPSWPEAPFAGGRVLSPLPRWRPSPPAGMPRACSKEKHNRTILSALSTAFNLALTPSHEVDTTLKPILQMRD